MAKQKRLTGPSDWLRSFAELRVGVIGDFAADRYLIGTTSRISREAPVLILKKRSDEVLPGQAGNSAANLAAIGVRCSAFGFVGADFEGEVLRSELEGRGIETSGLIVCDRARTIVKTRILSGAHHAALQQVIRLDDDEGLRIAASARRRLTAALTEALPRLDALLVSDYGYGSVTPALWKLAGTRIGGGRARATLRVLDSRYGLMRFKGADVITPNETEVFQHLRIKKYAKADPIEAGRRLIRASGSRGLVMTRGNEGMIVFEAGKRPVEIPIFGPDEVTDVTGAGDTVAAVTTAVRAAGGSLVDAARVANVAAGLVVMKRGAATVTPAELRRGLRAARL